MATLTQAYAPALAHIEFINKRDKFIEKLIPRRCMVSSVGLILAGMGIPILMAGQLLPLNLYLGFASIGLIATGGVLTGGSVYGLVLVLLRVPEVRSLSDMIRARLHR